MRPPSGKLVLSVLLSCALALATGPACSEKEGDNSMFLLLLLGGGGGGGGGAGGASEAAGGGGGAGASEGGVSLSLSSDLLITYASQSAFAIEGECSEENRDVVLTGAVIDTSECLSGVWSYTADLAWMPSGRYYLYVDHGDGAGSSAPQVQAVLEKNTLDQDATALYTFEDEGDPGKDHALAGAHDARKVSAVTFVNDADRGRALEFDGSAGEFQLSDGTFFNAEFDTRTLSFWARPRDLTGPRMLFDEGGGTNGMVMRIENGEAILAVRNGGAGSQREARAALANGDDVWYHIAAQFDRGALRLYVDGAGTETATGHAKISAHSDVGGVGRRYKSDSFGNKKGADVFDGRIDHFAVYERSLSAGEVGMLAGITPEPEDISPPGPLEIGLAAHYEFETAGDPGKDSSGVHPADTSNVKLVDDAERGGVGRFKTNSKFQISDGAYLNDEFEERSVALWFKPNKITTRQVLFDEGGATNGLTIKIEGKRLYAAVRAGGEASQKTLSMPLDKGAGVWYQTLVVYNRGELKLYLDGDYLKLDTGYVKIPTHGNEGGAGARHGNSDAFGETGTDGFNKGFIDDLRIYTRALGDAEAELLGGVTPAELEVDPLEEGLLARYAFDEASDPGLDSQGGHSVAAADVTVESDVDRGTVGRFDGTASSFPASDGKFLNDAFTARSVSLWFKPTDENTLQVLYDEGGTTNGLVLKIENGDLTASVRANRKQHDLNLALGSGTDVWYHAVVVFDAGAFTLYLDGTPVTLNAAYAEVPKHGDGGGLGAVHGGGDAAENPRPSVFHGDLDDVRIYERALSPGEVDDLGSVADSSHPLGAYLVGGLEREGWLLILVMLVVVAAALGAIQLWRRRQDGL